MAERRRAGLDIRGVVQGVGFRPFLYRLAGRYGLSGWVRNTASGVELELEGPSDGLDGFVRALEEEKPPLAVIDSVQRTDFPDCRGLSGFRIVKSLPGAARSALVSPDVGVCPDCLRELFDPRDRRYRYPFLNCTSCGPRFTIVRDVPYDRSRTSMAPFPMCPPCGEEYGNVEDRRYHAQPTCCPDCGPSLEYRDGAGNIVPGDPIRTAQADLRAGKIVAVKGLGGFHLACLAGDPRLIAELRRRKRRDEKPFALMCADVDAARRICEVSGEEQAALESWRRPIVLLKKKPNCPDLVSENRELGVMLPYTPLHYLLMEGFERLVMTSANLSDCPVVIENAAALDTLGGVADGFLLHDRDIVTRCDDSLIRIFRGREYPLRRSRGYAPQPLRVPEARGGVLACGAEQKASFALSKDGLAFLSQHIGDLKNAQTLAHYEGQIGHFETLFGAQVRAIACDLHPDHLSARYARDRTRAEGLPLIPVQHHHAHLASCLADNGLAGPCTGLVWDGTGYGADGSIWGGECLVGDAAGFRRLGSIRPIRLPGGDVCTRQIGRIAHSLLWDAGLEEGSPSPRRQALSRQLDSGVNCPAASSIGRLFDGVYALLTGRTEVSYEGQGAVLLESMAQPCPDILPLEWYEEDGRLVFDTRPMLRALWAARQGGEAPERLASAFMNTLVEMGLEQCRFARRETGVELAALTGGVFQNMYLLPRLLSALEGDGFRAIHHSRASANDEGVALGQLLIASKEVERLVSGSAPAAGGA